MRVGAVDIDSLVSYFCDYTKETPKARASSRWKLAARSLTTQHSSLSWPPGAVQDIRGHENIVYPVIGAWLRDNGITKLKWFADGDTAAIFQAKIEKYPEELVAFRLGVDGKPFCDHRRVWCPLVAQPYVHDFAEYREGHVYLNLELMPLLKAVGNYDSEPDRLMWLVRQQILKGTAYKILQFKDVAVLKNGTPVSLDPGSLNFGHDDILYTKYGEAQYDPAWQQQQMSIIYANCRRLKLPEPLNWVIRDGAGRFRTKQSLLYPALFPSRPKLPKLIKIEPSSPSISS